jgi:hypothetical protein
MITAGVVRTLLVVDIVAMALLALVFLRQRKLSWVGYCCWGLLAVAVPVLGPFLLIANRPGVWDDGFSVGKDFARLGGWLRRLLPGPPPKMSRLEKARVRRGRQKNR